MRRSRVAAAIFACIVLAGAPAFVRAEAPAALDSKATRAAFLKIIDRVRVEPAPQEQALPSTGADSAYAVARFTFASDADNRVPGLLYRRKDLAGHAPVVIVMHGTGGKKEAMANYLRPLADKGFVAVAIDARYHGERAPHGRSDYQDAVARAFEKVGEHPFYYDTVWDAMRLIDYLTTRVDVDAKRIGLIGVSKGGIETYLTSAIDERIAVSVPCIGVQSFRYALDNNVWQGRIGTIRAGAEKAAQSAGVKEIDTAFVRRLYDRIVPGIYSDFDGPAMLPLIAPRPLLVINGDSDDKTPVPGIDLCAATARDAYGKAGAEDHFVLRMQKDTGHKVNLDSQKEAIEWFVKWLKP